jgi:cell division protein FtsB
MMEPVEAARAAPANNAQLEYENRRLQTLVSELIKDNQELRFRNAMLEEQAAKLKRGLANSTASAGMLF